MNIKKTVFFALTMATSLGWAQAASAQDVFQTGETERDYNYFQATYIVNRRDVEVPVVLSAQVSVTSSFTLIGDYLYVLDKEKLFASPDDSDVVFEFDAKTFETFARAGIGYHRVSQRWSRIDWSAELLYQVSRRKVTIVESGTGFKQTEQTNSDSLVTRLGVRASITPSLELQAVASSSYSDKEFSNEQLNITGVYRVTTHFDIAIAALDATDNPNYNVGFRYNW